MQENKITVKRILLSIMVLIVAVAAIWTLSRPATGSLDIKSELPLIGSSPLYVEMHEGADVVRDYIPEKDMKISGVEILLVNTEATGASDEAYISVTIMDNNAETVCFGEMYAADVPVGDWISVPMDAKLQAGRCYSLVFSAFGCEPYFMQVDGYDLDISVGFDVVSNNVVTYGDIFYYSQAIVVLLAAVVILLILFGHKRLIEALKSLELGKTIAKYGCEAFMILLLIALALKIYSTAYIGGVYITADSDGYLREAVNLVAGKGFSYDGLAGYNSWFANWPIIYPAMIAGMMIITHTNAYLASKFVAILMVALIEVLLYRVYRKDAWIYALALTNLGFLGLAYHTWSEVPFILFLICFGVALGKIVSQDQPGVWAYVGLGASGVAVFLTRYFGIYVWFVAGLYGLLMLIQWFKDGKAKELTRKLVSLIITAAISGFISLAYLVVNKINNGNPTGVSRGTWWDDYQTLTNDLVKSIMVEIFNVFRLEVPASLLELPYYLQVWFIFLVVAGVAYLIHACLKKLDADNCLLKRYMSMDCVMIVMALMYYAMFIVIRYRSSMDTFYFRFFEPATFMLTLGLLGLVLSAGQMRGTDGEKSNAKVLFAILVTVLTLASLVNSAGVIGQDRDKNFYEITTESWDIMYSDISSKGVVIWSDLDYRSTWYRPDVVGGELFAGDSLETLDERYYGSDYLYIRKDYAESIVNEGDYDEGFKTLVAVALDQQSDKRYIEIRLK